MEKILTEHPKEKWGLNISKDKYKVIRKAIMESLKSQELTFTSLTESVKKRLRNGFRGSISWYVETVKLDLEAKNIIERIPKTKPQLYRLKKNERVSGPNMHVYRRIISAQTPTNEKIIYTTRQHKVH